MVIAISQNGRLLDIHGIKCAVWDNTVIFRPYISESTEYSVQKVQKILKQYFIVVF